MSYYFISRPVKLILWDFWLENIYKQMAVTGLLFYQVALLNLFQKSIISFTTVVIYKVE